MYIKPQKKWRKSADGSVMVPYTYYRLCESYRGEKGASRQRMVCGLGELEMLHTEEERKELARLLDGMLSRGEYLMSEREDIYHLALSKYAAYRETRERERLQAIEDKRLKEEAARMEDERKRELVTVKWKSIQMTEARSIGAEHVCREMLDRLGISTFLANRGWSKEYVDTACMQIIARAIYPYSEYRTVSYLRENSSLCEMFGVDPGSITKDVLYKSARRLYGIHHEMEDYLHRRVCSMFGIEEKIYLFDITNMYAEGVYGNSLIFQYGHSKEKRNDLKVVVLAAVVNTDGLLVRTEIYEGNIQDVSTLEGMIGSLEKGLTPGRRVIVMDAGFSSRSNLEWLRANGYDYVTVMRSAGIKYTPAGEVSEVRDNKQQRIRLQLVSVEGIDDRVLMVDSDAKAKKEDSMHRKLSTRFEEGLKAIQSGIAGRGTKKRDKVNNRLGRLYDRYPGMERMYDITITYDDKDTATSMEWEKREGMEEEKQAFHGKYFLQSSLDETDTNNIWEFYNVIRTVEETFKTLKTDLDIRPIYHKSDDGAKAHLNLAVLAYWIVSTVKYRLRQANINVRWEELLRIMSTQVRVSVSALRDNGKTITTRKSTEPEEKLTKIYDTLEISHKPTCSAKFVWHLKPPPKNNDS